ncbi:type I restriction enzyme HsdR N-terminal domain-containing protein [Pseudomonas fluorescens]|nr:type I restriction enzyme HsdR N-terminal domain-containing protein [Pseudomonas fluorescens]
MINNLHDWNDLELEASIDAYLEMLDFEKTSTPYSKVNFNRELREGALSARTKASIEFRMQCISHALESIEHPRISGYLPAKNLGKNLQTRLETILKSRLTSLPNDNHQIARSAIKEILIKYFKTPIEEIDQIIKTTLSALENTDYKAIIKHIAITDRADIVNIAESLNDFGLNEVSRLIKNAKSRLTFLDHLESLALNPRTLEKEMHTAIENNLWILGSTYSLFSSNITLKRQIENHLEKSFTGTNGASRPDLLLHENMYGDYLLIELKRPSHPINHSDYIQAASYRHALKRNINKKIEILIIGGKKSSNYPTENNEPNIQARSFDEIISSARYQTHWQLKRDC